MKRGQTTARNGLCLRDAPKVGNIIDALKYGTQLEVLSQETWLKVKTESGQIGYVQSDYVELSALKTDNSVHFEQLRDTKIITYYPETNRIQGQPIRIDQQFLHVIKWLEKKLQQHDISMWVTSSLREPGKPVSAAIVNPASLSNHFIGHAIDMNLFSGSQWFNSSKLSAIAISAYSVQAIPSPSAEERVRRFLHDVVYESGNEIQTTLRWGGQFTPSDPVHIDDGLNIRDNAMYYAKLKNIWPDYLV
ncbi:SH3 domain-containing protein [Rheinheimera aquimaris]|jgi:hypothetical protein|uniref:SH3 domain-containing protein n=1 Tax=Rheinheimera aquimaris TaxID=412437 RepID=UPI001065F729|nr:SH3 domain-containing protein [Rheinheimera aquimaris]|tara:strand:+ start:5992 stop:6735 length:744 start_codon:yes stop_codon:yes gene_type:complete